MSAHRWDIARGPLPCKRSVCTTTIGAGEPYRRVSSVNYAYCAACAKAELGEDPPPDLPAETYAKRLERLKPADLPASLSMHASRDVAQATQGTLSDLLSRVTEPVAMDYGQRAANDREPGEDG